MIFKATTLLEAAAGDCEFCPNAVTVVRSTGVIAANSFEKDILRKIIAISPMSKNSTEATYQDFPEKFTARCEWPAHRLTQEEASPIEHVGPRRMFEARWIHVAKSHVGCRPHAAERGLTRATSREIPGFANTR